MRFPLTPAARRRIFGWKVPHRFHPSLSLITLLIVFPPLAFGQSPFDTGFTALQTVFTGSVAKVASLIAIVVGGRLPVRTWLTERQENFSPSNRKKH
jgi:hypothetical protein